jgi:hypothetical protein
MAARHTTGRRVVLVVVLVLAWTFPQQALATDGSDSFDDIPYEVAAIEGRAFCSAGSEGGWFAEVRRHRSDYVIRFEREPSIKNAPRPLFARWVSSWVHAKHDVDGYFAWSIRGDHPDGRDDLQCVRVSSGDGVLVDHYVHFEVTSRNFARFVPLVDVWDPL